MRNVRHSISYLSILILFTLLALPAASSVQAQGPQATCFPETTGQCIQGRFLDYWSSNGGLPVFGYPLAEARQEVNRDTGQTYLTQWFERARFELHPENPKPYDVLLGRIGVDALRQRGIDWQTIPRETGPKPNCLWFAETGHNVCDQDLGLVGHGFRTYWLTTRLATPTLTDYQASLALFGYPLTEARMEINSSGDRVLTQWFERARLEWHPNNTDEFKVLLGRLGSEVSNQQSSAEPACSASPTDSKSNVSVGRNPFCVVWRDAYTNERGFRVVLEYSGSGERFTYERPANSTQLIIPQEAAPPASDPQCRRSNFAVSVVALRPGGETLVGGLAVETECRPQP